MKELAIHCTIYLQNHDGWNEDNPMEDANKALEDINFLSTVNHGWSFEYQVYDAEVREGE